MEGENTFKAISQIQAAERFQLLTFFTHFSLTVKPDSTFVAHQGTLLTSVV